jgi:dTDP-4-dehydrorhamnose reductase
LISLPEVSQLLSMPTDKASRATILVTGGTGQLATALAEAGCDRIHRVGRPDFDFDRAESAEHVFRQTAPALVVNAAAYTAVDAAETDESAAYRANHDGPALLAALCQEAAVPLIHVSTDYVFDGLKGSPYIETDPTAPQGVYGASKLAGETAVLVACEQAVILRTSWVYAPTGKNFVRTMLNAARRTNKLRVVADQKGCPTPAGDLAAAIVEIVRLIDAQGWQPRFRGVFHAAGTGWTTWHGLACAVFEEAARYGLAVPEVSAITSVDWPTPARRPPDSRLDCSRLAATFGVTLPAWRDGLARTIDAIFAAA